MVKTVRKTKGETLLEIITSLGILSVGIMFSTTIMGASIRNLNASKNRVIAVNIAREGLEAMRNIRDTNWLRDSSLRRDCWNHMPSKVNPEVCLGNSEPIQPGEYIIYKQKLEGTELDAFGNFAVIGWKWRLADTRVTSTPLVPDCDYVSKNYFNSSTTVMTAFICDGSGWIELARLLLVDTDPLVDTDEDGDFDNDLDAYNHGLVPDQDSLSGPKAKRTVFNRTLAIEYLDDDGTSYKDKITDSVLMDSLNRMRVTSTVWWQEGKNKFKVSLQTDLTDYLGRESLAN